MFIPVLKTKRNEPKTRPRVRRLAYTVNRKGTRKRLGWGLGGGAVYELLVGLREEDKTKLLKPTDLEELVV